MSLLWLGLLPAAVAPLCMLRLPLSLALLGLGKHLHEQPDIQAQAMSKLQDADASCNSITRHQTSKCKHTAVLCKPCQQAVQPLQVSQPGLLCLQCLHDWAFETHRPSQCCTALSNMASTHLFMPVRMQDGSLLLQRGQHGVNSSSRVQVALRAAT
jgi:hypothetical protein